MKYLFIMMMAFPSLAIYSQNIYPPPVFCIRVISEPAFTFNFHRPRKDCKSGLGICLRFSIGEYRLEPCKNIQVQSDEVFMENDKVHFSIRLAGEYAFVSLPADLARAPGFEGEDMGRFHVDGPHLFFRDDKTGMVVRFKEGDYPVIENDGLLKIRVDTELTYEYPER